MKTRRRRPAWGKIAVALGVLAGLAAAWHFTPLAEMITPQRLGEWARVVRQSRWAPFVLVVAYIPAAFVLFPRPLLTLIAVLAFGPLLGFTYGMLGILAAALVTYWVGRAVRYQTVRRVLGERLDEARHIFRGHAVLAVFAVNMVPVPPFGVQGIMAGAMRLNVWQYSLGTLLAVLPGALLATTFGNQIMAALEDPAQVSYWLMGAAVVLFAGFVYFARRWASRRTH
jgi:phospholipase D1/2